MKKEDVDLNSKSHAFKYREVESKRLRTSFIITLIFMVIEIIGGLLTNSIALLSDAGHMFTHCFAIGLGLIAIYIARRPPCEHKTFGLYRAEVLAAFINGLFLLVMVALIIIESIERMINPVAVDAINMFFIAILGFIVNMLSVFILRSRGSKDINLKGVFFHMIADAISSIGIIVVAFIIILNPNWVILDPLISIAISIIICIWAWNVLKESTRTLLEISPKGLDIEMIRSDVKQNFAQISEIFHMHLWTITPEIRLFSGFIKLKDEIKYMEQFKLVNNISEYLKENYKIIESTIQISPSDQPESCNIQY